MKAFSLKTKIAITIAVILWASAFAGIRAGLHDFSPGSLALLRFLIASICMGIIYFILPNKSFISMRDKGILILIGAVGLGCYHFALNTGELTVPSGMASFIISQSPIVTAFFAIIFLKEQIGIKIFLGMLISIIGVGLISWNDLGQSHFYLGIFYVFIAAVMGSFYSVMQKRLLNKYHVIAVTTYAIWGCTLSLLYYLPQMLVDLHKASFAATSAVIYLGIFPATIAYVAWSYALKEMPASRAVSFLYFMPVIATFLGWVWVHEVPTLLTVVGGLIALLGVWVVNTSAAHPPTNSIQTKS